MTLTTRLNLFFAATLAVVLAGFSASLYLLVRHHLHQQNDERLDAALNTLAAAAEVSPEGVEWEPDQRRLTVGTGPAGGELAWLVADPDGHIVHQAGPTDAADFVAEASGHLRTTPLTEKRSQWQGDHWQFRQQWVWAERTAGAPTSRNAREKKYASLSITVGAPLGPMHAELRRLAGTLAGLSLAVWVATLAAGRAVCRRALRPVRTMAAAARGMGAANLTERLPLPGAGDELDDLSASFNGLLGRVHEAFERQRRFTGDASHQLRTPLAAILGQAEVSLRRERSAEEYRDVLGRIQGQAGHMGRMVEALLFLARADAEAAPGELETSDLASWLTGHFDRWADHPRRPDLRLEVPAGETAVRARVQPALLGQLVDNLLDNSFKYSPAGSSVTVRLLHEAASVVLTVEDRGSGIAAEELPHIFEPFYRSAEAQRQGQPGIGLGLAVAQRIAVAFGGTLTAESEMGKWTRLTLRLPAAGE